MNRFLCAWYPAMLDIHVFHFSKFLTWHGMGCISFGWASIKSLESSFGDVASRDKSDDVTTNKIMDSFESKILETWECMGRRSWSLYWNVLFWIQMRQLSDNKKRKPFFNSVFRCVLASLYEGFSIRPSVRRSVRLERFLLAGRKQDGERLMPCIRPCLPLSRWWFW